MLAKSGRGEVMIGCHSKLSNPRKFEELMGEGLEGVTSDSDKGTQNDQGIDLKTTAREE